MSRGRGRRSPREARSRPPPAHPSARRAAAAVPRESDRSASRTGSVAPRDGRRPCRRKAADGCASSANFASAGSGQHNPAGEAISQAEACGHPVRGLLWLHVGRTANPAALLLRPECPPGTDPYLSKPRPSGDGLSFPALRGTHGDCRLRFSSRVGSNCKLQAIVTAQRWPLPCSTRPPR